MSANLVFTYGGTVEDNRDPLKLGRLKVRVPHVYGATGSGSGFVATNDLPWAMPAGMPAGGSNASGGFSQIPQTGNKVWVRFLDGEPEKPIWEWGMQSYADAEGLKLHSYASSADAEPDRTIWSRYGHSFEITAERISVTTREGQQVLLQTSQSASGGMAVLQTPKGQSVKVDDLSESIVLQALQAAIISGQQVILNAPTSTLVKTQRFSLLAGTSILTVQGNTVLMTTASGAAIIVDEDGSIAISSASGASLSLEDAKVQLGEPAGTGLVLENGKMSVNAPQCVFNTAAFSVGTGMGNPVLLLTSQMLAWLVGHTHTNGNEGSPTGPPIPMDPLFPNDSASTRMYTS